MIQGVSGNEAVPGIVVGVGSEVPDHANEQRFRQRTEIKGRFAIYIGRIDKNKGCAELFDHFQRYTTSAPRKLDLVLIGDPMMSIPSHPRIHHLGFVTDEEKFDAMAAADVLIMPSYYESLSMVTLEAWAQGLPVLVNGACDVLHGQVVRSNAGLYYTGYEEFAEALQLLETNRRLRTALGANGRAFFRQHYAWPVIEQKYLDMLDQLQSEDRAGVTRTLEPVPGWLDRHRRRVPPAVEVLERAPAGPVIPERGAVDRPKGPARRRPARRIGRST